MSLYVYETKQLSRNDDQYLRAHVYPGIVLNSLYPSNPSNTSKSKGVSWKEEKRNRFCVRTERHFIPIDVSHTCVCVYRLRAQRIRRRSLGIVMLSDKDICIGITVPTFPVPLLFQHPYPPLSCPLSLAFLCSLFFPLLCCLFLHFPSSNLASFSSRFNFPPA